MDISAKGPKRRILKQVLAPKGTDLVEEDSRFVKHDRRGDLSQYHKKSERSMRELALIK